LRRLRGGQGLQEIPAHLAKLPATKLRQEGKLLERTGIGLGDGLEGPVRAKHPRLKIELGREPISHGFEPLQPGVERGIMDSTRRPLNAREFPLREFQASVDRGKDLTPAALDLVGADTWN